MNKRKMIVYCATSIISTVLLAGNNIVHAAEDYRGDAFHITNLDYLLWSIVKTIQDYTIPVMALAMVFLGIKLVASGDDTASKDVIKSWMVKILIGGVFIFGAAAIANILKGITSGAI